MFARMVGKLGGYRIGAWWSGTAAGWVVACLVLVSAGVFSDTAAGQETDRESLLERTLRNRQGSALSGAVRRSANAIGGDAVDGKQGEALTQQLLGGPDVWLSPKGLTSSLQVVGLLTILSVAPAILLMTTCYVRVIVVFGLLKLSLIHI